MNLGREKKKKQLAEAMKEAGAGQGLKGATKEGLKSIASAASKIGAEMANEARTGGLSEKVQGLKKAEKKALGDSVVEKAGQLQAGNLSQATKTRDAETERQQVKRYKNAPASDSELEVKDGILSKGVFTVNSKKKKK